MIVKGLVHIVNTNFNCPYCNKQYNDLDDKYINKINKIKKGWLTIKCSCGEKFGMTYNYMSNAQSFKL